MFLNYLELGVDILIDNVDWSVKKFILHANNSQMPDFCFYDRCCFELLLSKQVAADQLEYLSEEIQLNQIDSSLCVSKINADPSAANQSDSDEELKSGIMTPPKREESIKDPSAA